MEMTQLTDWLQKNMFPSILGNLVLAALLVLLILSIYYLVHIGNRKIPESKQLAFGLEQRKLLLLIFLSGLIVFWLIVQRSLLLSLLTPFILAGAIAYALNPLILMLIRLKLNRLQAVIGLYLVLLAATILLSLTLLPNLGDEIRHLGEQLPQFSRRWYDALSAWYDGRFAGFSYLPDSLEQLAAFFGLELETATSWFFQSFSSLLKGFGTLLSSLVTLVTVPVLTFYFLKDADIIKEAAQKMVPPESRAWVFPLTKQVDHVLAGFIRGQLIVALFVGVLSGTALMILGIDFAILLGIIAGITNIIPYLGPFIGAVPAILMALLTSPLKTLWVILAFLAIQQVESSIISPRIVGQRVGLHPALVILSLLIGGAMWGLVGLIIAVPFAGIIRVLVLRTIQWFQSRYPRYFDSR